MATNQKMCLDTSIKFFHRQIKPNIFRFTNLYYNHHQGFWIDASHRYYRSWFSNAWLHYVLGSTFLVILEQNVKLMSVTLRIALVHFLFAFDVLGLFSCKKIN